MDAITPRPSRNSRWSRDPVIGRAGAPRAVYPTERDIEIFTLLVRYRYLPSDTIHAFVGGNAKALLHRLNLLSRKPNLYLSRPQQQRQNAEANYRPLIYQLDERGSRALRERGLASLPKSYHHNFAHELMVAQITASLELGTKENSSVQAHHLAGDLGARTHAGRHPRVCERRPQFGLRIRCAASRAATRSMPTPGRSGWSARSTARRSYLFFPGIEADCASEPIDAGDTARSSIAKKFAAYMAIAEQGLHRSHFGFPNFFVPFITTTAARLRTMMELLARMTGRARLENTAVQDLPELHVARTAAGGRRPHAHRAMAAGRLSAAASRSLTRSWTGGRQSSR